MVAANLKAEAISLMDMRAAMEAEMSAIIESLCGPRLSGNLVYSECCKMITRESQKVASLAPKRSDMSVSLSENTSQDSSTKKEAVSRIPFASIDEIDDDSPAAEDGLQISNGIVKFGNVEKGDNLRSRLMAEARSNQGNPIPSVIVRQGALMNITVTPRPWHGPGSLGSLPPLLTRVLISMQSNYLRY